MTSPTDYITMLRRSLLLAGVCTVTIFAPVSGAKERAAAIEPLAQAGTQSARSPAGSGLATNPAGSNLANNPAGTRSIPSNGSYIRQNQQLLQSRQRPVLHPRRIDCTEPDPADARPGSDGQANRTRHPLCDPASTVRGNAVGSNN